MELTYEQGDKVTCKRSLPSRNGPIVIKNNIYTVLEDSDPLRIKIKTHTNSYFLFSMSTISSFSHMQFIDYFYTEKELRKEKLNKINKIK